MKRKWIAGFFLCLILMLVFFQYGGRWVRDLLSPEVICIYPKMELLDEYEFHTFLMFPEECVKTENDGTLYIWTVSRTNEYPEEAFKANKRVIQITQETDDMVYVSFQFIPSGEAIVRNWTGQIADGGRVVVADDSKNHEVYRSLQLSQYENTACTEVCRRYFLWLILFPEDIFEL